MADTDPLNYRQRRHDDLDVLSHGLTLWDLDREFPVGGFAGQDKMKLRDVLGVLRDSYCRTVGVEYMHILEPGRARLDPGARRGQAREADRGRAEVHPVEAERGRGVRDVPADQVRRAEAVLAGGRRDGHRAAGRGAGQGRRVRAGRGRHRHAAPRPAERAGQHRRQADLADLPRVRGQPRPGPGARLRRRQVPPGRRGQVLPDVRRRRDEGVADGEPVAPGGRRPGAGRHRPGQAGPARQGRRGLHRAAGRAARRRRVRRPGRGRRDAEPGAAARLPHRRHRARDHQQPGRLHHRARSTRGPASTHRRREDDPGARSST